MSLNLFTKCVVGHTDDSRIRFDHAYSFRWVSAVRTRAGSRRPTNLHVLRSLQPDLRVQDVKGGTPHNFDL